MKTKLQNPARKSITILLILELLGILSAFQETATSLQIPSDWIVSSAGSSNLIITAPHGGALRATEIPERTDGCLSEETGRCLWVKNCSPASSTKCRARVFADSYTKTIGDHLVSELQQQYSISPYYIRCNLHRSRLDANRGIGQAAQGDPLAEAAWHEFHNRTQAAVLDVTQRFGRGLMIDLHGQTHSEAWTELGYLLRRYDLDNNRLEMSRSSLRWLAQRSNESAAALLSGPNSLGGLLFSQLNPEQQQAGTKGNYVPGPAYPSPNGGNYFNGGYITSRYSSMQNMDVVQIEMPSYIRKNSNLRLVFVKQLAAALREFLRIHY